MLTLLYKMEQLDYALNNLSLNESMNENINKAIFTRYLFIKQNVYWTLLLYIINKSKREALYWAYELYYSGFKKELIMFILHIFNIFYSETTTIGFKNNIAEKINNWLKTQDETILGTIIYNICNKNANISTFFKKNYCINNSLNDFCIQYKEIDSGYELTNIKNTNLFVNLSQVDIAQYKDINCYDPNYKTYYVLELITRYRSQSITNEIYNCINNYNNSTNHIKNLLCPSHTRDYYINVVKNMDDTLVHMYYTPAWKERIEKFGGGLYNNKIQFPNDDLFEEFCNLYWYEPDENLNLFICTRL